MQRIALYPLRPTSRSDTQIGREIWIKPIFDFAENLTPLVKRRNPDIREVIERLIFVVDDNASILSIVFSPNPPKDVLGDSP